MTLKAKSNEELGIARLRCNIIEQMEDCVKNNEAQKTSSYASALSMLPIYLDYEDEDEMGVK